MSRVAKTSIEIFAGPTLESSQLPLPHISTAQIASSKEESHNHRQDELPCADVPDSSEVESCLICLGAIHDRCVLPVCLHSLFCFECILRWIPIHRRCPLCNTAIGDYLIHSIRSNDDYLRHYLPNTSNKSTTNGEQPDLIRTQAEESQSTHPPSSSTHLRSPNSSTRQFGWGQNTSDSRRQAARERWDKQMSQRRRVYRQGLFCKHIGSSARTKLSAPPHPKEISATPVLQSTLLQFIRRELLAFPHPNLDVEFLATYILNVLKTFDAKSNEAIHLLEEFLGHTGAEHFCHELYSFLRFISRGAGVLRDKVFAFDQWAQYDWPEEHIKQRMNFRRDDNGQLPDSRGCSTSSCPSSSMSVIDAQPSQSISSTRDAVLSRRESFLNNLAEHVDTNDQHTVSNEKARLTYLAQERLKHLQARSL